ncbi:MAG: cobyric acid synthase [Halanaerobiaceae bacterium]
MSSGKNYKTIMIQGTSSDVGKSIICTALCRILNQDNIRVAPFKSWNMSLNSTVTPDGGEIGIAQALQAEAAGVIPTVDMQPVLVKPKGNGQTQVIVRGKPYIEMDYSSEDSDYYKKALYFINRSLENLKKEYDIIVMEGAGSPVEVNRKGKDLANMMTARLNKTPVLLVADIDRGGALASLVGTLKLLDPEDRSLVKGLILNRFRGDFDLLKPGIDFLEEYTGVPVVGVIPYLKDIYLPEEDAASLNTTGRKNILQGNTLNIAVINLPRMSNFTDFKSLEQESDVFLNYVRKPSELNNADIIIIPGSKSTTTDLKYLKKSGLADEIIKLSENKVPVIGICGGYQMMGKFLYDHYHTEGYIDKIEGLGLLPLKTCFSKEKITHQVKAKIFEGNHLFSEIKGETIYGYEIHMGETEYSTINSERNFTYPFKITERSGYAVDIDEGIVVDGGLRMGTYLHGIFNNDNLRRVLLDKLREMKGLPPINREINYNGKVEYQYDKLADIVRKNINLELLYSIISGGVQS